MPMKRIHLSCFGHPEDIDTIARVGYDLIEMHNSDLVNMSESAFQQTKKHLHESPIDCLVVNNPLPLDKRIADPDYDLDYYREYLKLGAFRTAEMGAAYWNFGNGTARTLPEGNARGPALEKFIKTFEMVCDAAAENGIVVLAEPLGHTITNIIQTIPEALAFIQEIGKPNLKTFVDMRWQLEENRPIEELYQYAPYLVHAHIDNPHTDYVNQKIRVVPKLTDDYDYTEYLNFIKSDSYSGALSIEALKFSDFETEIKEGLALFEAHGIIPYRNT